MASEREKERIRKARWRQLKKENDPQYINKVKQYDRERKKCVTSRSSRELSDRLSTPTKNNPPPSYYRVLSTSKKVQNILGPSPNMHTTVLKHVLKKAMRSPRKSSCMPGYSSVLGKDYITPPKDRSISKELRKIAILRSKKKYEKAKTAAISLRHRFKSITEIADKSGECKQTVYRLLSTTDKRRLKSEYIRKLTEEDRQEVIKIYNDDEVSYSLPDMKYAGLRFMYFTIHEAYEVYMRKSKLKRKVAGKTFEALKPKYVKTVHETPLRGARCEYCANFGKTREALIALGIKGIPRNHARSIEETWCKFRSEEHCVIDLRNAQFPKKDCALRKCEKCGVTKYERELIVLNRSKMALLKRVSWKQWESVKYNDGSGPLKSKIDIVSHTGSVVNLMKLYIKQLNEMSAHQFFKVWQLRNFNLTLGHLQRGQVLVVHDFQQNLLLITQDETLGSHWDHPQLTIHPTALFYRCVKCDEIVKEDLIHITMDKKHDKHAVNQFISMTIKHIHDKGIPVNEIIEFTDHAASQYKSRFTFYYLTELGIPCTRHYFGVKHGKGPSDRAGGNFKRKIRDAVKAGHILLNADSIEEYCKTKYYRQDVCPGKNQSQRDERDAMKTNPHSLCKVFNHAAIKRPKNDPIVRRIEGCRDNMHVVRNTGVKGLVEYRYFDCACIACTTHSGDCQQKDFADNWTRFNLLPSQKEHIEDPKCSEWFKPVDSCLPSDVSEFMEFEDEDDCDEIQCDEIESEGEYNTDEHDEIDIEGRSSEVHDVIESDVYEPYVNSSGETDESDVNGNDDRSNNDDTESLIEMFTEDYVSSDEDYQEKEEVYAAELPREIHENDPNVNFNWEQMTHDMTAYQTFTSMYNFINRMKLPEAKLMLKFAMTPEDIIDTIAILFWPKDAPRNHVPIETFGEGNCGPRAMAHLLLGNQSRHWEVRVRFTFVAMTKEDLFTQHDVLARGSSGGTSNRAASYAHYSGHISPEITSLTPTSIKTVYRRDVMANSRNYNFIGIWQFHHAAEAFKRPIGVIYPRRTNRELRSDMNRIILPVDTSHDNKRPVHVMWTPLHANSKPHDVKHFVAAMVHNF